MTHISLDIETWGTRPGCDIRSIGAVVFDPITGALGALTEHSFYIATENPQNYYKSGGTSAPKYPLTRDPATVEWWNSQSDQAQAAFAKPVDLRDSLMSFEEWLYTLDPADELHLWTKGPHFDIAILEAAYSAVGLTTPWHYRAPRDLRTAMHLASMTRQDECTYGTPHHALDDAFAQAMTICKAYERLGC